MRALRPSTAHSMSKNILAVCTSASKLQDMDTGLWLEELASPYWQLVSAGHKVTIASTKGGEVPLDPNSLKEENKTGSASKFLEDENAMKQLKNSKKIDDVQVCEILRQQQNLDEYDGLYIPGGHGAMVDFPDNAKLQQVIATMFSKGKVVASICHGPAAFVNVKVDGDYMVKGKELTSFSDSEEKSFGMDKKVPFLLESKLKEEGAKYTKGQDWHSHAVFDDNLITGQNPASSPAVGQLIVQQL